MYIHEEILHAVLPILKKHAKDDFSVQDLIAELNHAAWHLSGLNEIGIKILRADLKKKARGKQ